MAEPVAETKKVKDFLDHITDPKLQTGKDIVAADIIKLGNFEICQQFMKGLAEIYETRLDDSRNVSKTETDHGKGKGKGNPKRKDKPKGAPRKLAARSRAVDCRSIPIATPTPNSKV